jgi:hypothetical protein
MAEAGHFFLAISILLLIFYLTDGKFNKKVAVIFVLSNWIGPDNAQVFSKLLGLEDLLGIDIHWFIPFLLWAILLAYFYSYFSRFSVKKTERFYTLSDDGKRDVNWKNAYLICISGGLLHTFTDALFRHDVYDSTIKLLDGFIEPQIGELNQLALFGIEVGALHIILTYLIALSVVFILLYLLDKEFKKIVLFYLIYSVLVFLITLFFVGSEYDTSVIILTITFVVVPLMLLFYVDKDVKKNPTSTKETSRIKAQQGLKLTGGISLILSLGLLVLGVLAMIKPDILDSLDVGEEIIIAVGILVAILGSIMLVGSIGLFLRNNMGRIIIMIGLSATIILVFPLFIMFYLAQDDVKELFLTKSNENR